MRIIDVNNFYSPTGGGVRTYHDRRREYYRRRDDVAYALMVPAAHERRTVEHNVTTYEVPAIPIGAGYRLVISASRLRAIFADFVPDLIEVGSPYVLPLLVPRALGDARPAVTGFYHADYPDTYVGPTADRLPSFVGQPLLGAARHHAAWVYRSMDAVCAASEHVLSKLAALGVTRLFRTPLGLDSAVFGPERRTAAMRARLGADKRPVILYLARLATEKGIDLLMEAWERLAPTINAQLVIGGHGPARARVDAFCSRHRDVIRLDYLTQREDVAASMASADVFLSLGPYETFSLTTIEAMASGCVVVAPDAGGAGELVRRERAGVTFAEQTPAALAAAVEAALLRLDDGQRTAVARRIRADYDWNARLDHMTRVYRRVVEAKQNNDLGALDAPDGRWWNTP